MFKIYIFSRMEGVVLKDGKPVPGAVVRRSADHYNDKVYTEQTTTDENGRFKFDAITTRSFRPLMFGTVVRQEVHVDYGDTTYLAWDAFKTNNHHHGELLVKDKGKPDPIKCVFDLNQEDTKQQEIEMDEIRIQVIHGLCELV